MFLVHTVGGCLRRPGADRAGSHPWCIRGHVFVACALGCPLVLGRAGRLSSCDSGVSCGAVLALVLAARRDVSVRRPVAAATRWGSGRFAVQGAFPQGAYRRRAHCKKCCLLTLRQSHPKSNPQCRGPHMSSHVHTNTHAHKHTYTQFRSHFASSGCRCCLTQSSPSFTDRDGGQAVLRPHEG